MELNKKSGYLSKVTSLRSFAFILLLGLSLSSCLGDKKSDSIKKKTKIELEINNKQYFSLKGDVSQRPLPAKNLWLKIEKASKEGLSMYDAFQSVESSSEYKRVKEKIIIDESKAQANPINVLMLYCDQVLSNEEKVTMINTIGNTISINTGEFVEYTSLKKHPNINNFLQKLNFEFDKVDAPIYTGELSETELGRTFGERFILNTSVTEEEKNKVIVNEYFHVLSKQIDKQLNIDIYREYKEGEKSTNIDNIYEAISSCFSLIEDENVASDLLITNLVEISLYSEVFAQILYDFIQNKISKKDMKLATHNFRGNQLRYGDQGTQFSSYGYQSYIAFEILFDYAKKSYGDAYENILLAARLEPSARENWLEDLFTNNPKSEKMVSILYNREYSVAEALLKINDMLMHEIGQKEFNKQFMEKSVETFNKMIAKHGKKK